MKVDKSTLPAATEPPPWPTIYPCGCSRLKIGIGMCDTYGPDGSERSGAPATQGELEAERAERVAIAEAAGTCCDDPTPAVDDGAMGAAEDDPPGFPGLQVDVFYCEACDAEMTPEAHAALVANLDEVRARIARLRAERRGG